uniref:Uncharacterized protein n=1 Tax=Acrobeloides nanus TaxID=290746 RepID=A0A914C0B6_9BILA
MDVVYSIVESLYFFIPILAVIVVAATLYFGGRRSDEEEYLFMHTESADANLQALELEAELADIEKKEL